MAEQDKTPGLAQDAAQAAFDHVTAFMRTKAQDVDARSAIAEQMQIRGESDGRYVLALTRITPNLSDLTEDHLLSLREDRYRAAVAARDQDERNAPDSYSDARMSDDQMKTGNAEAVREALENGKPPGTLDMSNPEDRAFRANLDASQQAIIDAESFRAIKNRSESGALLFDRPQTIKEFVAADVKDLNSIKDPTRKALAGAQIVENSRDYTSYKIELESAYPGAAKEVFMSDAMHREREARKEERDVEIRSTIKEREATGFVDSKGLDIKFSDKTQAAIFEAVKEKHGAFAVEPKLDPGPPKDMGGLSERQANLRDIDPSHYDNLDLLSKNDLGKAAASPVGNSPKLHSDAVRKSGVNPVSNIGSKMNATEYASALQKLGGEGVGRIELPKQHCGYCGKIIQASDTHIVQRIGKNFAIAHDITKIANGMEILALAEKGQLRNAELNVNYNEKAAEAKAVKFNVDDAKAIIANSNTWAAQNISSPQSRAAFGKIVQDLATARTQAQEFKAPAPVQVVRALAQSQPKPQPPAR